MKNKRARLLDIIYRRSFKYDPNNGFKLVSGKMSDIYIDAKQTTTTYEGAFLTGEIIYEMVKDIEFDGMGGLTLGADPIAYSAMLVSYSHGKKFNAFIIRKRAKDHGTKNIVEGVVKKGDKVIILDDVVTTGSSTIEAITQAKEAGLQIIKAISLVDREEGGEENILKHVKDYKAIFKRSDLLKLVETA